MFLKDLFYFSNKIVSKEEFLQNDPNQYFKLEYNQSNLNENKLQQQI
jgi:hypothetical protein